jgi:hypothetical protein
LKRINLSIVTLLLLVSTFMIPFSSASAKGTDKGNENFYVPEVKFTPEVTDSYVDEDGNLVQETTKLPDTFVTDSQGNIISEGNEVGKFKNSKSSGDVSTLSCAYQYRYETVAEYLYKANTFVNYHPAFSSWERVSSYFFGTASVSYSLGWSGYGVSVGVSVAGPGYGYNIDADYSRWSRPAVYGDVWYKRQKVTRTGGCSSETKVTYQGTYYTYNDYIKVRYQ